MTFSIFEGQEPSQIIFQVKAGLCYLEFSCSQWTFDLISTEQQGVTRRRAVFIICDFDEAELQSGVGVAYDWSWHPAQAPLITPVASSSVPLRGGQHYGLHLHSEWKSY